MASQGTRADAYVRACIPSLSRKLSGQAFDAGLITGPSGKPLAKGARISGGEEIDLSRLRGHIGALSAPSSLSLSVLYRGDGFIVVDKPPGVASHPVGLFDVDTISHWAASNFPEARGEFLEVQPTLAPHRLDTGTSGCLLVALKRAVFAEWRTRFARKEVEKRYLAWCWGVPSRVDFDINFSLAHSSSDRGLMVVPGRALHIPPVLSAQTQARVVESFPGAGVFLVEARSVTGVTHQIRAHLGAIGFPLVGDARYDSKYGERHFRPPFHLLRAVALDCSSAGLSVTADRRAFISLMP